jgi:hypothetical protein
MKTLKTIATGMTFILVMMSFLAMSTAQNGYPQLTNFVVVRPQAIPTSSTDVIKQNAYVCYADFTATGQNISIQDRQATPVVWLNNVLGASMNPVTWFFSPILPNGCRPMPNGITIQAGSSGVTGTMVIGCPARCALTWGF